MAETTTTPAPQAAAMAAPQDSAVQAPDQSTSQTPTGQAVAANPSLVQPPTAQPPAAPAAPAAAQAHPKVLPKRGLMASVLMGALKGADDAMKTTGRAVEKVAENTQTGQRIRTNNLLMKQKQQEMEQAKQKAAQEQTAALDKHQLDVLDLNKNALANIHTAAENAHTESLWPTQDKETRLTLLNQLDERNKVLDNFLSDMESIGVHIDTSHFTQGDPFNQLTPDHATAIANGKQIPIPNGKTGPDSDLAFISMSELENTPLPHDVKIAVNWDIDAKTGEMTPVYSTFAAGSNTARDAYNGLQAGLKQQKMKQDLWLQRVEAEQKAALVPEEQAAAEKDRAQAKQLLMNAGIGDPSKTGDEYIKTLPPVTQDWVHGLLRYQVKPADLGRAQDRKVVIAAALHADTTGKWSDAQYNERYNFLKEWGDSQKGAGATKDRINTAVGHLDMLAKASQALDQNDVPALNQIANAIGVQMGQNPKIVYDAIAQKAASEAAGAMKGGGTAPTDPEIEAAAKSFTSNNGASQRLTNIRAQYGLIQTPINTLDGHFNEVMQQSPTDFGQPTLYPQNQQIMQRWMGAPPSDNTVPAGKFAAYDAQKNVIGYADDPKGTNFHKF